MQSRPPDRQRKPGGDGKYRLDRVEAKLFFILLYVKRYPTFDVASVLYQVHRSRPRALKCKGGCPSWSRQPRHIERHATGQPPCRRRNERVGHYYRSDHYQHPIWSRRACQAEGLRDQHPSLSGAAQLRPQPQRRSAARHCLPVPGRRRVPTGRRGLERYRDHDLQACCACPNRGAIPSTLSGTPGTRKAISPPKSIAATAFSGLKNEGS